MTASRSVTAPGSRPETLSVAAWIVLASRFIVGGYFVYSGWLKVQAPIEFLKQLRMYQALPEQLPWLMNTVAVLLPWLEIVCGVALVLGAFKRGAALWLALMLGVFTPMVVVRSIAIMRETGTPFFELAFDCGCGSGVVVIWKKLILNLTLFTGGVMVLFSRSRLLSIAALASRTAKIPVSDDPGPRRA